MKPMPGGVERLEHRAASGGTAASLLAARDQGPQYSADTEFVLFRTRALHSHLIVAWPERCRDVARSGRRNARTRVGPPRTLAAHAMLFMEVGGIAPAGVQSGTAIERCQLEIPAFSIQAHRTAKRQGRGQREGGRSAFRPPGRSCPTSTSRRR